MADPVLEKLAQGAGGPFADALEEHIAKHFYQPANAAALQGWNEATLQVLAYHWISRRLPDGWSVAYEERTRDRRRRADLVVRTSDATVLLELKYVKYNAVVPDPDPGEDARWYETLRAQAATVTEAPSILDISHRPYNSEDPRSVTEVCVERELEKLVDTAARIGATHNIILVGVGHRVDAVDVV